MESLWEEKKLNISVMDPDVQIKIMCDEYKIGQVVRNLLSNAIKHSPEKRNIEVLFKESHIQTENESVPALKILICDQGVGIPDNELDFVFDKFSQSSRTKTGAGGTGLGLAICKEIIEDHHGVIWAENNPQGGATFSFMLPYEQNEI